MPHYTGTITNANPAATYVSTIETHIATYNAIGATDNNTWTFVEEVTSISGWVYRVYKNNGSTGGGVGLANSFGSDFYLAFGYQTAAGSNEVRIVGSEAYNSSTDGLIRPVSGLASTVTVNANTSFGDETTGVTFHGTGVGRINTPALVTTGFEYHLVINRDGIWLGVKQATSDYTLYAGLFDPAFSYAGSGVPLTLVRTTTGGTYGNFANTSTHCGTTRHPSIATGSNANSPWQHTLVEYTSIYGSYDAPDRFTNKVEATKIFIRPIQNSATLTGVIHGFMKNCMKVASPSSSRLGDIFPFDGRNYLAAGTFASMSTSSQCWIDTEAV